MDHDDAGGNTKSRITDSERKRRNAKQMRSLRKKRKLLGYKKKIVCFKDQRSITAWNELKTSKNLSDGGVASLLLTT